MNIRNFSRVNFGQRIRIAENDKLRCTSTISNEDASEVVRKSADTTVDPSKNEDCQLTTILYSPTPLLSSWAVGSTAFGLQALGEDTSVPQFAKNVASVSPAAANFSMANPSATSAILSALPPISTIAPNTKINIQKKPNTYKEKPSLKR